MVNIQELEKRWLRYQIKRALPYALTIFASLSFFALWVLFASSNETKELVPKKSIPAKNIVSVPLVKKQVNIEKSHQLPTTNNVKKAPESENKLIITPSLNFINAIHSMPIQTNAIKEVYPLNERKVNYTAPIAEVDRSSSNISQTIQINRQNKQDDINDVIKRFNVSHNPALSLFISKKYYELGDYEKSYNYALATNEINSNIEDSWILFAKSLFKLNKKNKSRRVLRRYITHTNSNKAIQLLKKINSGEFQ